MAATRGPGVTVPDRRLRLSLLARTGSDAAFLELFPHRHNTDAFFAAVLQKR